MRHFWVCARMYLHVFSVSKYLSLCRILFKILAVIIDFIKLGIRMVNWNNAQGTPSQIADSCRYLCIKLMGDQYRQLWAWRKLWARTLFPTINTGARLMKFDWEKYHRVVTVQNYRSNEVHVRSCVKFILEFSGFDLQPPIISYTLQAHAFFAVQTLQKYIVDVAEIFLTYTFKVCRLIAEATTSFPKKIIPPTFIHSEHFRFDIGLLIQRLVQR